jgi:DNA-directed RNA polymerase beta' subunit
MKSIGCYARQDQSCEGVLDGTCRHCGRVISIGLLKAQAVLLPLDRDVTSADETVTERAHRLATEFFAKMGERGCEALTDDAEALVYHLALTIKPLLADLDAAREEIATHKKALAEIHALSLIQRKEPYRRSRRLTWTKSR